MELLIIISTVLLIFSVVVILRDFKLRENYNTLSKDHEDLQKENHDLKGEIESCMQLLEHLLAMNTKLSKLNLNKTVDKKAEPAKRKRGRPSKNSFKN